MNMLGENILVKEAPVKDFKQDGIVVSRDEDDTYMFVEVVSINNETLNQLLKFNYVEGDYLVIKRVAKISFIGDTYIISLKDVLGIMSLEEYDKL